MNKKLYFVPIIFLIVTLIYEKIDYKIHTNEIENVFINDISVNKHDYIGYIEISHLNIKREIVLGITDNNLKNYVTLNKESKNLESNNIILAGHAIKNIFGNLYKIKINDEIKIYSFSKCYTYIVFKIQIVSKNEIEVLDNSDLILITCINNEKRLIVKARRI